jgi:hypothetical protein
MITLDDIKSQWAEDSKIDNDLLDNESTKIPQLHSKYLNYLTDVRLIKLRKEQEYKVLIREKFEYYTGKASDEVYQENPFDLKVLKQDVPMYIDSDPEIQNVTTRINYYEEVIFVLEKIIQQLNNRTFQIKNSIDWQKFMQGSI